MTELLGGNNGEKRTTKDLQGGDHYSEFHRNPRSLGTFAIAGNEARVIEIPINRANCQRRNPGRSINGRDAIAGGILRQLIAQNRSRLAHRLEDIKRAQEDIKRSEDDIQRFKVEAQELDEQANEWEQLLKSLEASEEPRESEN